MGVFVLLALQKQPTTSKRHMFWCYWDKGTFMVRDSKLSDLKELKEDKFPSGSQVQDQMCMSLQICVRSKNH